MIEYLNYDGISYIIYRSEAFKFRTRVNRVLALNTTFFMRVGPRVIIVKA